MKLFSKLLCFIFRKTVTTSQPTNEGEITHIPIRKKQVALRSNYELHKIFRTKRNFPSLLEHLSVSVNSQYIYSNEY